MEVFAPNKTAVNDIHPRETTLPDYLKINTSIDKLNKTLEN
jgi:hypothetical protein